MTSSGISYIVKKDPQGAMIVTLAFMAKLEDGEPNVEYRPVALDDQKTRYLFEHNQGGGWSSSATFPGIVLAHYGFRLDPEQLPFDRVRRLGIEVVPAEVTRAAEAAKSVRAFQEAREAGIELLPRAEVGKPFEFTLTDSQGRALNSAALKGKVVLIDVWASWRSPCMGKMAEVKTLYDRRRRDGFEVVGVNFEDDRATTERLVKALGLPWPEVFVPDDDRTRRLWTDGPGLRGTPRLFLIDREGILRWSGGPEELEKRITDLLDAPRRSGRHSHCQCVLTARSVKNAIRSRTAASPRAPVRPTGMIEFALGRICSISWRGINVAWALVSVTRIASGPSARTTPTTTWPFLVATEYEAKSGSIAALGAAMAR